MKQKIEGKLRILAGLTILIVLVGFGFSAAEAKQNGMGITGKAIGKAVGKQDAGEDNSLSATTTAPGKVKKLNATEGKVNQGQLISAAEGARRVELMLAKHDMKSSGYTGPVSSLVLAFNNYTKSLKDDIREGIVNETDSNLTRKVVVGIAVRDMARIRNEEYAKINVSETNATETIENAILSWADGGQLNRTILKDAISGWKPEFKGKANYILQNGTTEEKQQLKEKIRDYVKNREQKINKNIIANIIKEKNINDRIRQLLNQKRNVSQILDDLKGE